MSTSAKVATFFSSYYSELSRFIALKFGFKNDAEDIVQEAFQNILHINNLDSIQNPKAYLYRAASNIAINHLRRQGFQEDYLASLDLDELVGGEVDRIFLAEYEVTVVRAVLKKVSNKDRQTFLMNRVEGKSYREIAEILNITVSAVEKRMMKVLSLIRQALDQ